MSLQVRVGILIALSVIAAGVMLAVPPLAQPLWYHDFADQRCFCGIPHTLNVVSNLPFVIVGLWGTLWLLCVRRPAGFHDSRERWPYVVFFVCIALTGVGSAYYHADPNNDRLLWDRLPLAMAFMALLAIIIAERIDHCAGMILLVPLVALGAGSVVYWHWTETIDQGDLRLYLFVQFYPLLVLPLILVLFRPRYTRTGDLIGALAWYVVAKVLEILDRQVYAQGQIVSGHTLKHVVAAVSPLLVLLMICKRRPIDSGTQDAPLEIPAPPSVH